MNDSIQPAAQLRILRTVFFLLLLGGVASAQVKVAAGDVKTPGEPTASSTSSRST